MLRSLLMVGILIALLGGSVGCQSETKEPIKADPNAPKQRFPKPTPTEDKG